MVVFTITPLLKLSGVVRALVSADMKVILLVDNYWAHLDEGELISNNIFPKYLPENVTALIQPMDQEVLQNMNCHYKKDFLRTLINHYGNVSESQNSTQSQMQSTM